MLHVFQFRYEDQPFSIYFYNSLFEKDVSKVEDRSVQHVYRFGSFIVKDTDKWIKVSFGSDTGIINFGDPDSSLSLFVGDLFVEVCDVDADCLSHHILNEKDVGKSIGISGTGFVGQTYIQTSLFKFNLGSFSHDNRWLLFNMPLFGTKVINLHTGDKDIDLSKLDSANKEVSENNIKVVEYSSSKLDSQLTSAVDHLYLEMFLYQDFLKYSLIVIEVCGKNHFHDQCDWFQYHRDLINTRSNEVFSHALPYVIQGSFYEVAAYFLEQEGDLLVIKRVSLGSSLVNQDILGSYKMLLCSQTDLVRCHLTLCTFKGSNCDFKETSDTLRLKVRGQGAKNLAVTVNNSFSGARNCVTTNHGETCDWTVTPDHAYEVYIVEWKGCTAHLMPGKNFGFTICAATAGYIKITVERTK